MTDTGSNSMPVLDLRPVSKSPRVHQGYLPPSRCLRNFVAWWGLCVIRVRPTELGPIKTKIWLNAGNVLHQLSRHDEKGSCPRTTQFSLRFYQDFLQSLSSAGQGHRVLEDGASGSSMRERQHQACGKPGGLYPTPGPHNSVCPGFFPELLERPHLA